MREIAREDALHFRSPIIHSEQDKDWVKRELKAGRVKALRNVKPLDDATIDRATRIVGMMGAEPFQRALDEGADVVLAGRSSDPAPWAGCATRADMPPAPSWYAGKMLECGATAALPKGHDCLLTSVSRAGVVLEAMNPIRLCTPFSVANHSLHENATPCFHIEPGGLLDTSDCVFEAVNERAVRVSGMAWTKQPYTVKLEGAELAGYRAITICGTRDPMLVGNDRRVPGVGARERGGESRGLRRHAGSIPARDPHLWRQRRDGGLGAGDGTRRRTSSASWWRWSRRSQETANAVLAIARVQMLHVDFPGRLCKEGNMAFPYSPSDIETAPAYRFSVFHTVAIEDLRAVPHRIRDV